MNVHHLRTLITRAEPVRSLTSRPDEPEPALPLLKGPQAVSGSHGPQLCSLTGAPGPRSCLPPPKHTSGAKRINLQSWPPLALSPSLRADGTLALAILLTSHILATFPMAVSSEAHPGGHQLHLQAAPGGWTECSGLRWPQPPGQRALWQEGPIAPGLTLPGQSSTRMQGPRWFLGRVAGGAGPSRETAKGALPSESLSLHLPLNFSVLFKRPPASDCTCQCAMPSPAADPARCDRGQEEDPRG